MGLWVVPLGACIAMVDGIVLGLGTVATETKIKLGRVKSDHVGGY